MRSEVDLQSTLKYTFFLHSPSLGGAELSTLELVKGLIARGNKVDCIMPSGGMELAQMLRDAGAQIHELTTVSWWTHSIGNAISESSLVESLLHTLETDLVVTITGVIPQAAIAARNLKIPHIWCLHEFMDLDHGFKIPFQKETFSHLVFEYSDRVICNSRSVRDYFFESQDSKIEVVYPFPQNLEVGEGIEYKNLSEPFTIGLIANFSPEKGHLLLLSALARLRLSGIHVKVIFFGEHGSVELRRDINAFIKENLLADRVEFRGYVRSKKEIFSAINAAVVPSSNEGFGRVPFESMTFGVPVIYSESGALSEYMVPFNNGLPFKAKDSLSLANAIENLINQETIRVKLRNGGLRFIREIHESKSYILKFDQICKETVAEYLPVELHTISSRMLSEISKLDIQRDELTHQRDELTHQRDELTHQRDELTHQRDELTHQRDELINSTIWKISKPLRLTINYLKKLIL